MEPGGVRYPGAEIPAQGGRTVDPRPGRGRRHPRLAVAPHRRRGQARAGAEGRSGGETSAKQCFDRLAGTWTYWGWKGGYFDAEDDAHAYFDELRYMLAAQMAAPNS